MDYNKFVNRTKSLLKAAIETGAVPSIAKFQTDTSIPKLTEQRDKHPDIKHLPAHIFGQIENSIHQGKETTLSGSKLDSPEHRYGGASVTKHDIAHDFLTAANKHGYELAPEHTGELKNYADHRDFDLSKFHASLKFGTMPKTHDSGKRTIITLRHKDTGNMVHYVHSGDTYSGKPHFDVLHTTKTPVPSGISPETHEIFNVAARKRFESTISQLRGPTQSLKLDPKHTVGQIKDKLYSRSKLITGPKGMAARERVKEAWLGAVPDPILPGSPQTLKENLEYKINPHFSGGATVHSHPEAFKILQEGMWNKHYHPYDLQEIADKSTIDSKRSLNNASFRHKMDDLLTSHDTTHEAFQQANSHRDTGVAAHQSIVRKLEGHHNKFKDSLAGADLDTEGVQQAHKVLTHYNERYKHAVSLAEAYRTGTANDINAEHKAIVDRASAGEPDSNVHEHFGNFLKVHGKPKAYSERNPKLEMHKYFPVTNKDIYEHEKVGKILEENVANTAHDPALNKKALENLAYHKEQHPLNKWARRAAYLASGSIRPETHMEELSQEKEKAISSGKKFSAVDEAKHKRRAAMASDVKKHFGAYMGLATLRGTKMIGGEHSLAIGGLRQASEHPKFAYNLASTASERAKGKKKEFKNYSISYPEALAVAVHDPEKPIKSDAILETRNKNMVKESPDRARHFVSDSHDPSRIIGRFRNTLFKEEDPSQKLDVISSEDVKQRLESEDKPHEYDENILYAKIPEPPEAPSKPHDVFGEVSATHPEEVATAEATTPETDDLESFARHNLVGKKPTPVSAIASKVSKPDLASDIKTHERKRTLESLKEKLSTKLGVQPPSAKPKTSQEVGETETMFSPISGDIDKRTAAAIYRMKSNRERPDLEKAMTAGHGYAGAPGGMTGGSSLMVESLDRVPKTIAGEMCDKCGGVTPHFGKTCMKCEALEKEWMPEELEGLKKETAKKTLKSFVSKSIKAGRPVNVTEATQIFEEKILPRIRKASMEQLIELIDKLFK